MVVALDEEEPSVSEDVAELPRRIFPNGPDRRGQLIALLLRIGVGAEAD